MFPGTLKQDAFDGAPEIAVPQCRCTYHPVSEVLAPKCGPFASVGGGGKKACPSPEGYGLCMFVQVSQLVYFNFFVLNSDVG